MADYSKLLKSKMISGEETDGSRACHRLSFVALLTDPYFGPTA